LTTLQREGYKSELIFIFLADIETAKKRVRDRIARGGHSVWEETIEERFVLGLKLLDLTFRDYDFVSLYLSQEKTIVAIGNIDPPKKSCSRFNELPQTLKRKLPNLNKYFSKYS
jgi:predicted ABC-type ATPase